MVRRVSSMLLLTVAGIAAGAAVAPVAGGPSSAPATRTPRTVAAPSRPRRRLHLLRHHSWPVPVLAYHVIAAPAPGAPYKGLYVTAARLRSQLRALARAGYHGVTLRQVFDYWRRGVPLPKRPVVVSFDDGYLSDYTRAAPELRQLRWPGVLNLELGNVRRRGGLTARMIRSLVHDGWEIDSHTLTHPDLTTVDAARLRHELVGARAEIRRRFRVPADFFCYPAGRFDTRVVAAVRRAGYLGALTEVPGLASPSAPYELARVRVSDTTTVPELLASVRR